MPHDGEGQRDGFGCIIADVAMFGFRKKVTERSPVLRRIAGGLGACEAFSFVTKNLSTEHCEVAILGHVRGDKPREADLREAAAWTKRTLEQRLAKGELQFVEEVAPDSNGQGPQFFVAFMDGKRDWGLAIVRRYKTTAEASEVLQSLGKLFADAPFGRGGA